MCDWSDFLPIFTHVFFSILGLLTSSASESKVATYGASQEKSGGSFSKEHTSRSNLKSKNVNYMYIHIRKLFGK